MRSSAKNLGLLKHLNNICGTLRLNIAIGSEEDLEEVVKGVREAELRNKMNIEHLTIWFEDCLDKEKDLSSTSSSRAWTDVMEALEPHPNLRKLGIFYYKGSKIPWGWTFSPLNQLRNVCLRYFNHLTSLPSLGKLPFLEDLFENSLDSLEVVGREFLGITRVRGEAGEILNAQFTSNSDRIVFPKLKSLGFWNCIKMKEWEDITVEEEECVAFQVMPCLTLLELVGSNHLTALPHRLLHKATSLKTLDISGSEKLKQRYANEDGSDWKSITQNNPGLRLCGNIPESIAFSTSP